MIFCFHPLGPLDSLTVRLLSACSPLKPTLRRRCYSHNGENNAQQRSWENRKLGRKIMFALKPMTARRPDLGQRVRMTGDVDASGP